MRTGRSALAAAFAALATTAVGIATLLLLGTTATAQADKIDTSAVIKSYAEVARAVYGDSLAGAKALQEAVGEMIARPSTRTAFS